MKRILCMAAAALAMALFGCSFSGERPVFAQERRTLPILMYHSVLKNPARRGAFVVSPDAVERDIRFLLDRGYETVGMEDVLSFVLGEGTLPEKPVMLTFDDGHLNNQTYVLPLLEQYDCQAVISLVGAYTERFSENPDPNPNYAYVSWAEAKALAETGRFELLNHSYDLHGQDGRMGSKRMAGESEAAYRALFTGDVLQMQRALMEQAGAAPKVFTYPFGVIDPLSRELLMEMGFSGSLSCYERMNVLTRGDPTCLWELGRWNRRGDLSTEAFMARVFPE